MVDKAWMLWVLGIVIVVMTVHGVVAVPGGVFTDSCYGATWGANGVLTSSLKIENSCVDNYVLWDTDLNLTVLGNVTDGEVVMGEDWIAVDSTLRPDLDAHAVLVFMNSSFALEPEVLVDGTTCSACNVTSTSGEVRVAVPGFSNYSLTHRQDFTVYSDDEPELKQKVYQTVDLGDARRTAQYACIVQVFGRNAGGEWVLVQTNPERKIQARLFGSPDNNQPEALGYFPTVNGLANTYFRSDNLFGYMNFDLVVQCTSNSSSKLVYEEPIMTTYSPAGRPLVSRGVWLTSGDNAFYVTVWVVFGFLALWIGSMIWRSVRT